jgi:hypothetical protein
MRKRKKMRARMMRAEKSEKVDRGGDVIIEGFTTGPIVCKYVIT